MKPDHPLDLEFAPTRAKWVAIGSASDRRYGNGRYDRTGAAMAWFWRIKPGKAAFPHAVPLEADLARLMPAFAHDAEIDEFATEINVLVARLRAADVPVEHRAYPGATHGFTQDHAASALARAALDDAGAESRTPLV